MFYEDMSVRSRLRQLQEQGRQCPCSAGLQPPARFYKAMKGVSAYDL